MRTSASTAARARNTCRRRKRRRRRGGSLARPVMTVKVVELVAEDFVGVIKPLAFERLACPGVGALQLLRRGVQLIGEVIGPTLLDRGIHQLPGHGRGARLAFPR